MTSQQTRTSTQQNDKAARQPKPKPVTATPAVESEALQRALSDPLHAPAQAVLVAQKRTGNRAVSRLIQTKPGVQRAVEEEELQMKPLAAAITPLVQRAAEEEEEIQAKPIVQRAPEEEEIQTKPLIQRADGPNAAKEIKGEDIEYEIIAHRLAYQDVIAAGAKQWLDSRGYEQDWHQRVVGTGLAVGLLLPKPGSKRRAILAFKGTSPEKVGDVLADLDPVAVGFTAFKLKQAEVAQLMQIGGAASAAAGAGNQVDVVGHSLGGALAQHAASAFPGQVKRVVTFQAPGISTVQANLFKGTQDVSHHVAAGDIVDLAGGKHLPGNTFFHDVSYKYPVETHTQYLLNSDAFKSQREAVGLTDDVLQDLGVSDKLAKHSGHVSKTARYPFRVRQSAVEYARTAASPLAALAVGGLEATKGLASTAKNSWNAGVGGAKSAWQWGGGLADKAWQGTRSWGRDEHGQAKGGVGNWFKRLGGNVLGGLGVAGGRVLGGLGAAGSTALGTLGAVGAGAGALATGAGTAVSGLGALGMGLGGLAVGGAVGGAKWAAEKTWSGVKKGAELTAQAGKSLWGGVKQGASTVGQGLAQFAHWLNPFKKKEVVEDSE
jgi:pimeloyl-ACP methyl ester carboxylesterase